MRATDTLSYPPQLWRLEMVKDRNRPDAPAANRLSLRHTYLSKSSVDVAGPSNFGGKDDQLVLCASKGALIRLAPVFLLAYR